MKKTALFKDTIRNISNSKGRFISIVVIIALGVAFFSGLKKAPEDMKYTADKYYKDYNLFDIRVVSSLGLTDDDVDSIKKIEGVEDVRATYFVDAIAKEGDNESVFRIFGYDNADQINGYKLLEGRFPENEDECLIEKGIEENLRFDIGSKIKLKSGKNEDLNESIENKEYTVVGAVQSPYYLSFEKGNSSIGNGRVSGYIVVPEENFKLDVYTDIYMTVQGSKDLNSYSDEYFELTDKVVDRLESLAPEREKERYNGLIKEAEGKLKEAKDEYEDGKGEAELELNNAKSKLDSARRDLETGQKKLNEEKAKFETLILDSKAKIAQGKKDLEDGYVLYEEGLKKYEKASIEAEEKFKNAAKEIEEGKTAIKELEIGLSELEKALENPHIPEETLTKLQEEYNEKSIVLSSLIERVTLGEEEIRLGKEELLKEASNLENVKKELDLTKEKINQEEQKLIESERKGRKELESNEIKIEKGKRDLLKAEEEYNKAEIETTEKLEDAWEKIEQGERDIRKIEKAKWHVLDRNSHYSYVDYEGAADRINALSKVFPVFFALVAALVCLTSMTRMVDEQRVNIGTLKALGYSNLDIALKYILYALIASIVGCIIGFAVGYTLFPLIIFNAYGLMYVLPPVILSFNLGLSIKIAIVAILLTTITTYLACINELKENSASLMRPKAPKIGKRILLERIPFIWNKFNFSNKVTLRNIFRYKRRFFMTVFGIAGCTALILAGFGIKDSIKTVVNKQYGELFNYDASISLDEGSERFLEEEDNILNYTLVQSENGYLKRENDKKDITIIVPKNIEEFEKFVSLQERVGSEEIKFPMQGIVISEQISKTLELKVGDEVKVINKDDEEAIAQIKAITENYTFNFGYMSEEYYRDIFLKKPKYTTAYANISTTNKEIEDQISKNLMANEGIKRVSFNSILKEDFNDVIDTLDYIVIVMIVFAGALAFVVLYNLTNVNISERHREIATIKVLGFYDNEVSAYIYRENIILTIIGALLGLVMGIYLHRFIMITVEMENIMFGLELEKKSYIYALVLTFIFSILVNVTMHYKLKNIEMVESLKSVD